MEENTKQTEEKEVVKYFSQDNITYLLTEITKRLIKGRIGE